MELLNGRGHGVLQPHDAPIPEASLPPGFPPPLNQVLFLSFGHERVQWGFAGAMHPPLPAQPQEQSVLTYYPGITDPVAARPIELSASQELTGTDIRLHQARVYRILGRVTGFESGAKNLQLMVLPRDRSALPGPYGTGGVIRPDGTFENVAAPGSYAEGVFQMDWRTWSMIGRSVVDVRWKNVDGVAVRVGSAIEVSGGIQVERNPTQPEAAEAGGLDLRRVQLILMEGRPMGAPVGQVKR